MMSWFRISSATRGFFRRPSGIALRTALVYSLISGAWILISDHLVGMIATSPDEFTLLSTYKGTLFVLVTATLLFLERSSSERATRRAHHSFMEEFAFRQAMERSSQNGVVACNREGIITYVNPAFTNATGWGAGELLNTGMPYPFWLSDKVEGARRMVRGLVEDGTPFAGLEIITVRKDRTSFPTLLSASPLRDDQGAVLGGMFQIIDITARKAAEDLVRQSEAFARVVLDSIPADVAVVDRRGRVLAVNQSWERHIGETGPGSLRSAGLGADYIDTCRSTPLRDGADVAIGPGIAAVLAGNRPSFELEYCWGASPDLRWIYMQVTPLLTPEGGAVIAHVDVTERKLIEQRIAESLEEKELLLKEIHHRVKNNMQIISSMLNLQASRSADTSLKDILLDNQMRIRAMATVHEHLYGSDNLAGVDLVRYVQALASQLRAVFHLEGVAIQVRGTPTRLSIDRAIPVGLLVNELLNNALKHAFPNGAPGVIAIDISREEERLKIVTKDNGVGIPEHVTPGRGRTMGMTIIHGLVDQLGATIAFERAEGTTVTLDFPL